jgi:CRP/FNR family transcriptional regulator
MNTEDMAYLQETLPFWEKLTSKQQKQLADAISVRTFKAGESIHRGSEDCSGLFLVKSGQVRAYIISETGKEITLYRLFERDICIFSASCMLHNINFDIFAEAEKDTAAFLIPTDVYQKLSANSLAVSDYTNQLISSRFSDVMWIMEQILFMSFDRRLALFLLQQANIEETDKLYITHETIAKHMGTAREVVTRMLKYFALEGLVELFRGGLIIKNRKKLEKLT